MGKWIAFISVKYRNFTIILSIILAVLMTFGAFRMKVNFDILSMLPESAPSVKGLRILEKMDIGDILTILVQDIKDLSEVESLKREISKIPSVRDVIWLSDVQDLVVPEEIWIEENKSQWMKDDNTIIQLTLKGGLNPQETNNAINEIKAILPPNAVLVSESAVALDLASSFSGTTLKYFLSGLLLVLILLYFSFPSILIPLLMVGSISWGILVSLGIIGWTGQNILFATQIIVAVLQLAVTLDYNLFLYYRYIEEKEKADPIEAMERAIESTFTSISGSALTTIAGFGAMKFSRIAIPIEMGFLLVRGVLLSLVATLFLFPAVLLLFDRILGKRTTFIQLKRIGNIVPKYWFHISFIFVLLLIGGYWGYSHTEKEYNYIKSLPQDLPSVKAWSFLESKFSQGDNLILVAPEDAENFKDFTLDLKNIKGITSVISYFTLLDPAIPEELIPSSIEEKFISNGYSITRIQSSYLAGTREGDSLIEKIKDLGRKYLGKEAYITGFGALIYDLEKIVRADNVLINRISFIAIFLILCCIFYSISLPLVLILVINSAIWWNIGIYYYLGGKISFIVPLTVVSIQLGSTIDYAVLLSARYKEERSKGKSPVESAKIAVMSSIHPILISAGTMTLMTLPTAIMSNISIISQLIGSLSRGALISMSVVILLLPSVLIITDPVMKLSSYKWGRGQRDKKRL